MSAVTSNRDALYPVELDGACLAVRAPGPGICRICCGPVEDRFEICWSCRQVGRGLLRQLCPVTAVSLTTRATGLYAALKQYKGQPNSVARRQRSRLAGLTAAFLERHGECAAPGGFEMVAVVPSLQMRAGLHPLAEMLRMVRRLGCPVVDALERGPSLIERNTPSPNAYRCRRGLVEHRRILLVDDTYTTGAHLHSAAAALEDAGASVVHLLVVGRHQDREWAPTRRLLEWASLPENRWSCERCVRCRGAD
jgi:predicted amidophosphoribosyltransferase